MSQSKPYNIVVTRDPKILDKVFFDKYDRTSFSERFGSLTNEEQSDAFLVSPNSRNGFISLEASFPESTTTRYVVLKLMETNRLLEYFNIPTTALETKLLEEARYNQRTLGDSQFRDKIFERLIPQFFISFGIGDDISQWSGPYRLDLADVSMQLTSDGIREMELLFTPLAESLALFTNKINNDQLYSQTNSMFDTEYSKDRTITSEVPFPLKSFKNTVAAWNEYIQDVVATYLSDRTPSTPFGNTLVLLPDAPLNQLPKPVA